MTEVAGRLLGGRYRMEALLASGGMGEVWAARDRLLDRAVAVKVLGGAFAGDGRAAERLRREARAAGRLEHPAIARMLDLGEDGGRPYLVMELLEGESLAERIARAGPMGPAEAARVVAAVADALEAAHRAGVVHRDVKPGNVFLTSDGGVKVLDFGIASAAGDTALTTGDLLGTAAYLAPERALGHQATAAADVYALGVVLYELLAGRRPFEAGSDIELAMAHVNADPVPLAMVAPSVPPPLAAACQQAMAKDPAARPRSAAAFARLVADPGPAPAASRPLRRVSAAPATVPLRAAASPPPRPRRARRRGLLVALVVAGAVLAALPALVGGPLSWAGGRIEEPFALRVPGLTLPGAQAPGQAPADRDVAADPAPAQVADPPAGDQPARGDNDDRDRDDDSSGSGRSGGGSGGSSGPG
jgi:serine/threonine protein kinase